MPWLTWISTESSKHASRGGESDCRMRIGTNHVLNPPFAIDKRPFYQQLPSALCKHVNFVFHMGTVGPRKPMYGYWDPLGNTWYILMMVT